MYRGILDGVDLSMMVHTSGGKDLGCNGGSNGCMIKEAVFTGKSAHAGGSPQLGINALYAANCAMQAANALRETFVEKDYIRFHPIITAGGDAVNAIPDRVMVESYVRASTMEALARENQKINRAFAGAAAAMDCGVHLWDHHGYAPREYDPNLKELCRLAGIDVLGEEQIRFIHAWSSGCSDLGDVSCVMPAIHPQMGGANGTSHTSNYTISDPVRACVDNAKVQCAILDRLLRDDAAGAKGVLANGRKDYPTIPEYLASIDALCIDKQAVTTNEDGTMTLSF